MVGSSLVSSTYMMPPPCTWFSLYLFRMRLRGASSCSSALIHPSHAGVPSQTLWPHRILWGCLRHCQMSDTTYRPPDTGISNAHALSPPTTWCRFFSELSWFPEPSPFSILFKRSSADSLASLETLGFFMVLPDVRFLHSELEMVTIPTP